MEQTVEHSKTRPFQSRKADHGKSAKQNAENYGAKIGEAWDVEDESLRAEFAGLDLTEAEMADLHEAFRLRRNGASRSEQIASRTLFATVRRSLAAALKATLDHETGSDQMIRALAVFDRDELKREEALTVALMRPISDQEYARLSSRLHDLETTREARRAECLGVVRLGVIGGEVAAPLSARNDAMRIKSRDGLATLHAKAKITLRQVTAGYAYRRRWEAAHRGLQSVLRSGGGSASPAAIAAANTRAASWELERSRCDTAVVLRVRTHPDALAIMRRVAGEGEALTSVVGNGRRFEYGLTALTYALDVAANVLPFEDFSAY